MNNITAFSIENLKSLLHLFKRTPIDAFWAEYLVPSQSKGGRFTMGVLVIGKGVRAFIIS